MKSKYIGLCFFSLILWFGSPILLAQPSRLDNVINQLVQPFIYAHQTPGLAIAIYYNGKDYYYILDLLTGKVRSQSLKILFLNWHRLPKYSLALL